MICDQERRCLNHCTTRIKYTENKLCEFLLSKNLDFDYNKCITVYGTKYRPDFLFKTDNGCIIIENDEKQHKNYNKSDEECRMVELYEYIKRDNYENVHFIRFNPDRYSLQESKSYQECLDIDERHELLFNNVLNPILNHPEKFFTNHTGRTVRYMFYDNYDGQFEVETIDY